MATKTNKTKGFKAGQMYRGSCFGVNLTLTYKIVSVSASHKTCMIQEINPNQTDGPVVRRKITRHDAFDSCCPNSSVLVESSDPGLTKPEKKEIETLNIFLDSFDDQAYVIKFRAAYSKASKAKREALQKISDKKKIKAFKKAYEQSKIVSYYRNPAEKLRVCKVINGIVNVEYLERPKIKDRKRGMVFKLNTFFTKDLVSPNQSPVDVIENILKEFPTNRQGYQQRISFLENLKLEDYWGKHPKQIDELIKKAYLDTPDLPVVREFKDNQLAV